MAGLLFFCVMALSIVSINANGLRDANKRSGFLQWLRSFPTLPDIVCIQECHVLSLEECQTWFSFSGFSCAVSPGSSHSCGCIVLFRSSWSLCNSWHDDDGRLVQCEFSVSDKIFRVVCLYAPNRNPERDSFFDDLVVHVDPSVPTILCGDFNAVFDRSKDRRGSRVDDFSRESCIALRRLFDSCCVIDVWRHMHPDSSGFTWTGWDGSLSSRIDLFGCPLSWIPSVSSCEIYPCPFSDHCALRFCVSVPEVLSPGPGLWKLNISILNESEYVGLISNFWREWQGRASSFPSLAKWWEAGKSRIKGLTINYCCSRAKSRTMKRDLLSRLVEHLKKRVDLGHASCFGPYQAALSELGELDLERARGAQVRSRVTWVEEGESSSAFFFRLEKKRGADRHISAVRDDGGSVVTDINGICRVFTSFYSSLFTSSPIDNNACASLLSNVSSSLSSEESRSCEGMLTVPECLVALQGMARRKAPGCDGLPMEFYLKFWDVLGPDLVAVLNSCYGSGFLTLSQRRGVISLSFKKGDRLDPRNWRPISLLNVDYKLAARVIAGRLLKVIHLVVANDQTCGVPGRYIGENVAFLRDVVEYAESTNRPVAILSLDQEKAFDRVEWSFMRATLLKMGFGASFVRWVDLFYCNVQSAVNVNGYVSPFFSLSRGVRQGCPLSPLLYVLVAEVLACNIRASPCVTGLSLPGSSQPLSPISQYADDTSLVLSSDASIKASFETYALFERGSGSKLNLSKSKGLWLGAWKHRADPPVALDWSSLKLKVLGVYIGPGNLEEENWRPRITAVENVLKSWRQRALSFRGRALIINALALSRVWYVASLVHMPNWVLKELSSLVFGFFWKGKVELVSRVVVTQSPLHGGFSVVDVKCKVWSLVTQWVRRFVSSSACWVSLASFWFQSRLNASFADVLSRPFSFDPKVLPPFYRILLLAWRALDGSFSTSRSSLVVGSSSAHQLTSVSSLSAKLCYLFLLTNDLPTPHCVVKFTPTFGDLYWSTTWRELFFFDIDRPVIDLSWKIAHGVLYTADRLFSFGYSVPVVCFCGPVAETLQHLFFPCPLAQSVLSWLQSLMFRFSPVSPSLVCRHVLFGFNADELRCVPRIFVYILNVCKYFIWRARNDFRFRDVQPGAASVIDCVKSRVNFHLPLFFKRFKSSRRRRYFHRQWGACGVVGSVVDGSLSLWL